MINSSRRCGAAGAGRSTRPRMRARPGTCFSTCVMSCSTGVCLAGFSTTAAVTSAAGVAATEEDAVMPGGAASFSPVGADVSVGMASRTGDSILEGRTIFASSTTGAGTTSGATLTAVSAGATDSTTAVLTAIPAGGGATAALAATGGTVTTGRSTAGAATVSGTDSLRRRRIIPPLSRSSSTFLSI